MESSRGCAHDHTIGARAIVALRKGERAGKADTRLAGGGRFDATDAKKAFAAALEFGFHLVPIFHGTIQIIPTPRLNVRSNSSVSIFPIRARQRKIGRTGQEPKSMTA
jgi:hypothetical protein